MIADIFAILVLLARLGLRAGEVAALELGDFDWRHGEMVIRGKGRHLERLPLPVDVGDAVVAYLRRGRPGVPCRAVFVGHRAPYGAMSTTTVRAVVRRACRRVGVVDVGTHRLRHSVATNMLAAGSTLAEIGQVLRHHDQVTTAIYAKVDRVALASVAQPWPEGGAR